MKRTGILGLALILISMSISLSAPLSTWAQDQSKDPKKDAPAATGKHLPQAKTQPEFDAYQAAMASTTPEATEKAADDFAVKYPTSEIKILIYKQAMQLYQSANNADKIVDMGRKCLTFDADDPQVLANISQALTDHTNPTDLDKDQKYAEAQKDAEKALQTMDTDLLFNPGTPQEKIDEYKSILRSTAYGSLGIIYYSKDTKEGYAKAEDYLRKSIDAFPAQPDPVTMLRLAIALDKQEKYPDALTEVNKVVAMTKEGTSTGDTARREQSRLQSLTKDLIK